jgi:hypothetical protein
VQKRVLPCLWSVIDVAIDRALSRNVNQQQQQ